MERDFFAKRQSNTVLAVVGPTASGKSDLGLRLALGLGGEIVSCDSMQIYRGMDIGTAKPTQSERAAVRHHLIDVADPDTPFSCADYAALARAAIADVQSRGKLPILVGGTGLYFESAVWNRTLESPGGDPALRAELDSRPTEENFARLSELDPDSAAAIHPNNRSRVIRALEIVLTTGIPKSEWDRRSRENAPGYDTRILTLTAFDREVLYRRIDRRVDRMMEQGLLDEVRRLNLSPDSTAGQAIGYKELADFLAGREELPAAVEKIKQASRNYAKRQITWFKRYKEATVCDLCDPDGMENIVKLLLKNI